MHVQITEIGRNKSAPRVWLQGALLSKAGFEQSTQYEITQGEGTIVLTKCNTGNRVVSGRKRNDKLMPVIDINSDRWLSLFNGLDHVRVIFGDGVIRITALASEQRARDRLARTAGRIAAGEPLTVGSLAHGGGVLSHALHTGFAEAGITTELVFANEIRDDLMEQAMIANDAWTKNTKALCGKMQELAFDDEALRHLPQVDVLEAGLPCSGASVAGRAKRRLAHAEAHPEVGHLVVAYLALIARFNPTVIVLEQVIPYGSTASMDIIRNQLLDLQYDVHETVIVGEEWNAMEHRNRMLMIGVTRGVEFSFDWLQKPVQRVRTLSEILEPVALDDSRWSRMQGLVDKAERDREAGNSFAMQIFDETSTRIGTLTKGLSKVRSTDPKIRHPENPELMRLPIPLEHARAKDCPPHLSEGLSDTIAHEMLGQSVLYRPFVAVGRMLARCMRSVRGRSVPSPYDDLPLFASM